jgi:branched-chain amino acid transport system permease protein
MTPEWLSSNLAILPQLVINSLITGSIYALASSGLALTYGVTKVLNFAHGHLMMVGAYLFFGIYVLLGLPFVVAGTLTVLTLALLGTLVYWAFIQPFASLNPLLPFVTTLALSACLEAVISLSFGVNVLSFTTSELAESWSFYSIYITPLQVIIIAVSIVLLSLLGVFIHFSKYGRAVRSMSSLPFAAQALGLNSRNVLLCSFIVGVILAGIAGILIGYETNLQPTMGNVYTIKAFAAMILGGLGSIWGTILGAYILGFVENFAIGLDFGGISLPAGYRDAFAFLLILMTLLFRPRGLLGSKDRSI